MRLEHEIDTHPRLLRNSGLGKEDPGADSAKRKRRSEAADTRFIGATHLNRRQKAEISGALQKRRIGDEMGRQIFVCAVEYQLTVFGAQLAQRCQTDPEAIEAQAQLTAALREIAAHAHLLAPLLRDLPAPLKGHLTEATAAQDARERTQEERDLCELGCEIERLERAASAAAEAIQPEPARYDPAPSRPLVRKLAKAYAECFEEAPTADTDGGFAFALETLGSATGLVIGHEPEFLAEILR
jgi:hypothetical protein